MELEDLRQRLLKGSVTFEAQVKAERRTQREEFLKTYARFVGPISDQKRKELTTFAESDAFATIPLLHIEARLFAAILTRKDGRQIQRGDGSDIDFLSAYAPYVDVVCTDGFMADQLRFLNVANDYGFEVFGARKRSLQKLKMFLESFLRATAPIRRPSITAFVMPPKHSREQSFQFFHQLGSALGAMGMNEYGEIYAFDDGAMPTYELRHLPGRQVPFYGLQDVTTIPLPPETSTEEVLRICREHCRSDHFVLINEYRDLPETFMLGAAMSAASNMEMTHGYEIHRTRP